MRPRVAIGCTYCRRIFNDKSNLRRHEITCKSNPLKNPLKYICMYPHCGKEFARPDGLRFHQRGKGHEEKLEVFIKDISPPPQIWDQSPQRDIQTTELYSGYEWIWVWRVLLEAHFLNLEPCWQANDWSSSCGGLAAGSASGPFWVEQLRRTGTFSFRSHLTSSLCVEFINAGRLSSIS